MLNLNTYNNTLNNFFSKFILILIIFLTVLSLFNISFGLDDLNAIKSYNDEAAGIAVTYQNLINKNFSTSNFYYYGYLYNYISFFLLFILELFGQNISKNPKYFILCRNSHEISFVMLKPYNIILLQ